MSEELQERPLVIQPHLQDSSVTPGRNTSVISTHCCSEWAGTADITPKSGTLPNTHLSPAYTEAEQNNNLRAQLEHWVGVGQGEGLVFEEWLENWEGFGYGEELVQENEINEGLEYGEEFRFEEEEFLFEVHSALSPKEREIEEKMQGDDREESEEDEGDEEERWEAGLHPRSHEYHPEARHTSSDQRDTLGMKDPDDMCPCSTYANKLFARRTCRHGLLADRMDGILANESGTTGMCAYESSTYGVDTDAMYPEICDAGEALADIDGISDWDLYQPPETPQTSSSEEEEASYHGDIVMLSGEDSTESSDESSTHRYLSSGGEEDAGEAEEEKGGWRLVEQLKEEEGDSSEVETEEDVSLDGQCLQRQDSSYTEVLGRSASDSEDDCLSEDSDQSSSLSYNVSLSHCLNNTEATSDKHDTPADQQVPQAGLPVHEPDADGPDMTSDMSLTLRLPFDSVAQGKSEQGMKGNVSGSQHIPFVLAERSELIALADEPIYEEPGSKSQEVDSLQNRKCLMTCSVSGETDMNIKAPCSSLVSTLSKGWASSKPQCTRSYSTEHRFHGTSTSARISPKGCLSEESLRLHSYPDQIGMFEIPPPFELSSITKRPIRKSSPALPSEVSMSCRKIDFGFKRYFLPLRFRRKSDRRSVTEDQLVSYRSFSESTQTGSYKQLDFDRHIMGNLDLKTSRSPSSLQLNKYGHTQGGTTIKNIPLSSHLESGVLPIDFGPSLLKPRPNFKPRSLSFPNGDSSEYENVSISKSHYENLQPSFLKPSNQSRQNLSSASDTDGYVDMSSLPGLQGQTHPSEQDTESAYTLCSPSGMPGKPARQYVPSAKQPDKRTERRKMDRQRQTVWCSRAFYSAKELVDSEREHVQALNQLWKAVDADDSLMKLLSDLPPICSLHQDIHTQLDIRMREWEHNECIADVFLEKRAEFAVFSTFIGHFDNRMNTLEQQHKEESSPISHVASLKQLLLQVIARVLKYRLLLTDHLNNLSPDTREYQDTQAAVLVVSEVADQAHDNLQQGVNLSRLVHIEHSVLGLKDLLQPGRVCVKEGTLMKVSRKCRQPRHLFLMNDLMLYTYPQQDGKYRLINTLTLTGMKICKPLVENVQHALKIEVRDVTVTLSAGSSVERDEWFLILGQTLAELTSASRALIGCGEALGTDTLGLGKSAPSLVPISQATVCMSCPTHFSLTQRRHHCHACGKVVCRGCCRNKFPLLYLKNRRAKVCDQCHRELRKQEGGVTAVTESSSRPLSVVLQNMHPTNLWKSRKGHASLSQETSSGIMSGTLQRSRSKRRGWKSLWFLLKDKVLYTYQQPEERVAYESLPLLGFCVRSEAGAESSVFQLYHKTTLYYTFRAQDTHTAQRWVNAMEEATVL